MRNLKRVLSLALATVMLLGMMVIGAGAADAKKTAITDLDKAVNKEAVNLMVDLGIIVGKPDGTFDPTGAVDRATMAKLITYIMMGDVSADLFEGTTTDLKDIDASWAKGYIKYCYANKIIGGDGQGSFFPTKGVTTAEASKMLLVAIGYDAKAQGYEGSSWSINVMRDAKIAGLLKNIPGKTNDALTRDTAAQMIFNALMTKTITYKTQYDQGVAHKTDPTSTDNLTLGQLQYNIAKAEGVVGSIDTDGTANISAIKDAAGKDITSTEAAVLTAMNKLPATGNMVGSSAVAYYNSNTKKLISTRLSIGTNNVIGTLTSGIASVDAYNAIVKKGDKKFVAEVETVPAFFLNGASASNANSVKVGAVVEFVDQNGNGKAEVVRITEKKVATLTAAPVLGKNAAGDDIVTIGTLGLSKVLATKVVGYEGLAKGDVILYVQLGDTTYIEKAASVEGVVTGEHSTKGWLVDGTYYVASGLTGASVAGRTEGDFKNTFTLFLDNGKNVVKAVKVTDKDTAANYAVLVDIAFVQGSGVSATNYLEAKLLFTDGTTEIVKVATVNGYKVASTTATIGSLATGATHYITAANLTAMASAVTTGTSIAVASVSVADKQYYNVYKDTDLSILAGATLLGKFFGIDTTTATAAKASVVTLAPLGGFYEYSKNSDGNYALKNIGLSNKMELAAVQEAAITKGVAKFNGTNSTVVGNANTVFIYSTVEGDKTTYTTYTGIANAPTTSALVGVRNNAIVANADGVATYVFVSGAATTTSSKDYVYIIDGTYTTSAVSGTTCYIYDALVNGVKVAGGLKANAKTYVKGLYPVSSIDSKDIYTLNTVVTTATGIKSIGGGTIQLAANFTIGSTARAAYSYDEDSKAYFIDKDGVATESTVEALPLSASNTVFLTTARESSDKIVAIYVMQVAPVAGTALTSVTLGTATDTSKDATVTGTDILAGSATVTGWKDAENCVKVTATAKANYTVKSITLGNASYVPNATGVIDNAAMGIASTDTTMKVTVGVADNFSGVIEIYSFNVTVSNHT